jgi:hypothetical protein
MGLDRRDVDAVGAGQPRDVGTVGCPEQGLEPIGGQLSSWGQEREDGPAVVVDHHDREVDLAATESDQSIGVMHESQVPHQRHGRGSVAVTGQGHPDRSRHDSVDPVGPAVCHHCHVVGGASVPLQVPDRHRRRHHEHRVLLPDDATSNGPGNRGVCHPSIVGLEVVAQHVLGCHLELLPASTPPLVAGLAETAGQRGQELSRIGS